MPEAVDRTRPAAGSGRPMPFAGVVSDSACSHSARNRRLLVECAPLFVDSLGRGVRVVECTGLEIRCGVMRHRGFESHPLRQGAVLSCPKTHIKPALILVIGGFFVL